MKRYEIRTDLSPSEILDLIHFGEQNFSDQLESLSQALLAQPNLHFLGLTGPTCSGKTTAANLLTKVFEADGKQVYVVSIDDFYYDKRYLLEMSAKKGLTTLDYDSEDTIDVELLRACVESLRDQKETRLPRFNFITGERERGETVIPSEQDIFLFEGIQVLYPSVDRILRGEFYRSIHIAPQSEVETGGEVFAPNEIRLMRRLVRDYHFRNSLPDFTLTLWQSVRENEERLIFPNVSRCDYSIDSTMPYEIGILKPFLERILPSVPKTHEFFSVGETILKELREVQPFSADLIPQNSLYKEFI